MSKFIKYQHIEPFGHEETEGIQFGECYIFPKIDGTNSQLWWDNGLRGGSRNRELYVESDNRGFFNWAVKKQNFIDFFNKYPNVHLFGEWLVPHTLKTYVDSAWNNFYVFDVIKDGTYIHYEEYRLMLEEFGIDYIPPICKIINPDIDKLILQLEKNVFLIQDGKGTGEGIVIKNYSFKNKYGRVTWAKIVKNEFKAMHSRNATPDARSKKVLEDEIVNKFVTKELIEKEFAKIKADGGWTSIKIPRLLNTVYYCLVKEYCWEFVKQYKNPTINFKSLNILTTNKIKELKPEIF